MSPNSTYILWLGTAVSEKSMLRRKAVSPAANRWQSSLVQALGELGQSVVMVGHVPEAAWPHGPRSVHSEEDSLAPELKGQLISYTNVPFVRGLSLQVQYRRAVDAAWQAYGPAKAAISYNAYDYNVSAGRYLQQARRIPWVCVVADAPGEGKAYERHQAHINTADGCVFLGWAAFQGFSGAHKLHLDGGVAALRLDSQTAPPQGQPVVMFSGALSRYTGVDLLAEAFHLVRFPGAELWITGPGANETVDRLAAQDNRIKVFGLVTDAKLKELSAQASVFVNPRPSSIPDNRMNFPSKVLEYLSYGKPVISTLTPGLSPNYRDILIVPDRETPESLARSVEQVLAWDEKTRSAWRGMATSFLVQEKLWSVQAASLLRWLDNWVQRR